MATVEIPRKIWTREETHSLANLGFTNAAKLELINGELIDHMGKKHPHVLWQHLIFAWLVATFGTDYARSESPIDVSAADNLLNEPEPDLAVTSKSIRDYTANPAPEDLRLVIEVADSTLSFDLQQKAQLYARAGIVDYWVVDIKNDSVYVHRAPHLGAYGSIVKYGFNDDITSLAKPDAVFCAGRL